MAEKEILLLKDQIEKLYQKKFELEAWKSSTLILIERIFGKDDLKLKMINSLKYDYSSWNMRNTAATGKTSNIDPVLMQAEEIMQAAIAELQTIGLPVNIKEKHKLLELLSEELTGKHFKELELLIKNDDTDKEAKIAEILNSLNKEKLVSILVKLLTD